MIQAADIISMGFTPEMFGLDDATFTQEVNKVIAEQQGLLAPRITQEVFDDPDVSAYVDRALKCLVAAEMMDRRMVHMMANAVHDDGPDLAPLQKQKQKYAAEAEAYIDRLIDTDFASGVVVSGEVMPAVMRIEGNA